MSQTQSYICSSPYLRLLSVTVEKETQLLLAKNPMRATLRAEHYAFVKSLVAYRSELKPHHALPERLQKVRVATLETEAVMTARPTRREIEEKCQQPPTPFMETALMQCKVTSVSSVGPRLIAQYQRWAGPVDNDPALGPMTAVILYAQVSQAPSDEANQYQVVGWAAADDADLGAPTMVEGDKRTFVTLPRTSRGSSSSTTDVVLMGETPSGQWREINVSDWFQELQRRLPRGLQAKSAFSLDLLGMRGSTDLARETDANCCPSGGSAEATFLLREDTLTIDSLVLRRPQPQNSPPRSIAPGKRN